jgi:hypothetical protein
MRGLFNYVSVITALVLWSAAVPARADVCIQIDEAHDTLTSGDRAAALLLVGQEFERAGLHVVRSPCEAGYTLSHVRLGDTITVTMDGPRGQRQGTAIGLDDLPHLYSQMVRSFLTGRPIGSLRVVDRTNVTKAQDEPPRRLASDRFGYARLGYGTVFGDRAYGAPAFGFGYRAEFDHVGVDVSFFNYALASSTGYGSPSAAAGSLLKLEGLYFANPRSGAAPYVGAGISWGGTDLQNGSTYWRANGLQGEVTAGYEIGRASSVKLFVQADAVLPFYRVASTTYTYQRTPSGAYTSTVQTHDRYAPALIVSFGMGWQKGR